MGFVINHVMYYTSCNVRKSNLRKYNLRKSNIRRKRENVYIQHTVQYH